MATAGLVLFPGDESSSFLDAKVASQLSPADLVKLSLANLVMHKFLDIFLALKHLRPDPVLPERISRIGRREDVSFVNKNSVQKGHWMKDSSVLRLKIFMERGQAQRRGGARDAGWRRLSIMKDWGIHFEDFPGSPWEKRDRASAAPLAVPCQ